MDHKTAPKKIVKHFMLHKQTYHHIHTFRVWKQERYSLTQIILNWQSFVCLKEFSFCSINARVWVLLLFFLPFASYAHMPHVSQSYSNFSLLFPFSFSFFANGRVFLFIRLSRNNKVKTRTVILLYQNFISFYITF